MKAKFSLLGRVSGKFITIKFKKGVPLTPGGVSSYYIRFTEGGKRQYKNVGADIKQAVATLGTFELHGMAAERGVEIPVTLVAEETNLTLKVEAYLEKTRASKAHSTLQAYTNTLNYFKQCTEKTNITAITSLDVFKFKNWLTDKGEFSERTIYNHFLNLMAFLKWAGVKTGIKKEEWPEKIERDVEEYTEAEIESMLAVADSEERFIIKSFFYSGLRDQELAHLTYGNIDFKNYQFRIQPQNGWKTKNKKARTVPVPPFHIENLKKRMETIGAGPSDIVFPNDHGKVNGHFLRIVKRVGKRAKITGRVDCHKFRSTCATLWLRRGESIRDVAAWLGHSNLDTVMRYLASVNLRSEATQKRIAGHFEKFAAMGGD